MKILIIGSDSFIAGKFIQKYSDKAELICVSRTKTGNANEIKVKDYYLPELLFMGVQCVFNFAAIVHRPDIKDEGIYDEVNHRLVLYNALNAKKSGVRLFIQLSSVAVYGNADRISPETPYEAHDPYGKSKLKADESLLSIQDSSFMVAIVRPPLVYGGGPAPGNMMRLISVAMKGLPLPFKDAYNVHDFINVNNLVQYLFLTAEKRITGIILVTDHEPVSSEYILSVISKVTGRKIKLFRLPEILFKLLKFIRPEETGKLFGSMRIETNFPFEQMITRHSFEEGISEMVKCLKTD
jgi:UDP-glucose 4-epimerase